MRKSIIGILLIVVLMALCGCGKSNDTNRDSDRVSHSGHQSNDAEPSESDPDTQPVLPITPEMDQYREELVSLAIVNSVDCKEQNGKLTLIAKVAAPSYATALEEYWPDMKDKLGIDPDAGAEYFELVLEAVKKETKVNKVISLDLSNLTPAGEDWSNEELRTLAEEEAFQSEFEAFCMEKLLDLAPDFSTEEDLT